MEHLRRKRGTEKGKITRIQAFIDKATTSILSVEEITTRHEVLCAAWQEFNKIHSNMLEIAEEEVLDNLEEEYAKTEEDYCKADAGLKKLVRKLEELALTSDSTSIQFDGRSSTPSVSTDVKLPRLELPTFSGDYLEWTSFHDLFVSVIHENSSISAAQKLYYLKGAVKNEAATLLHAIDVTDANYTTAWTLLKDRYQNERQLVQKHLSAMFSQPCLLVESASGLQHLLDNTVKHVRALNTLGIPTEHWDSVLVFLLSDRLDPETRRQWELSVPGKTLPSFESLKDFLEQRCRALQATCNTKPRKQHNNKGPFAFVAATNACSICNEGHAIYSCPKLTKADNKCRIDLIRAKSLCFNCLRVGHSSKQCTSKSTCRKCSGRHHTLLHFDRQTPQHQSDNSSGQVASIHPIASHVCNLQLPLETLLATAMVMVADTYGRKHPCRALIDSGSQACFITEACAQQLRIKKSHANIPVHGIGKMGIGNTQGVVSLHIGSSTTPFNIQIRALVLPKLTSDLPSASLQTSQWTHLQNLPLADSTFHKRGKIDLLLGADVFSEILMDGRVDGPKGSPTAHKTQLGWIVCGRIDGQHNRHPQVFLTTMSLDEHLRKFWEIEDMPGTKFQSAEEQQCEEFFVNNHYRDGTGRYTVSLPIKQDGQALGSSRDMAVRRFLSVERRLDKQPQQKVQYIEFMREYLSHGHMEKVNTQEFSAESANYLPHHFVTKEGSSTTCLRVVFDASAPTSTGVSLNDKLMVGPKLQDDITDILLRFRLYLYAFAADIAKMYRQIRINRQDADLQRIVWREEPSQPMQEYRLLTVTYGTASAPYLAVKVLQDLAIKEGAELPLAKSATLTDFYVDNLMSGADDLQEACQLQKQMIELMHRGGFHLRKWSTNHPDLLRALPPEDCESSISLDIDSSEGIQALGLQWNPVQDCLSFISRSHVRQDVVSKRTVLANTAKLFDPLGWITPVTITARILLQQLWLAGVSWDEAIPEPFRSEWLNFHRNLKDIHLIKVPRCVLTSKMAAHQLHGFSDASEKAYGASLYLRAKNPDGSVHVHLLCSRTKVSPTKKVSLPRLELCAAVLLANLIAKVSVKLKLNVTSIRAWCDSKVTLAWISGHPSKWKTFVANRVTTIQSLLSPEHWSYVPSEDNPADLASRGTTSMKLMKSSVWWNGPGWLSQNEDFWPSSKMHNVNPVTAEEEQRSVSVSAAVQEEQRSLCVSVALQQATDFTLITRFSSLTKLCYVTAYCFRFCNNARAKANHTSGPITKEESSQALLYWIKRVQHQEFPGLANNELSQLQQLNSLSPFLDASGILRVGGRLRNSKLSYDQCHPILLPKHHTLTTLIISSEHIRLLHAGPQLLLASLQRRYWIVGGRSVVRHHVFKCIKCYRTRAATMQQMMGDIPRQRLVPTRPFFHCGVDYGGPFQVKSWKGRGGKLHKSYMCVFVCFSTKAIHLEIVSDATTDAFLAALRRFIARRGLPRIIYSDNATNFVGASRELKELQKLAKSKQHNDLITQHLANEGITWCCIPPKAPHFGGLWEAGVKSVKVHLKKVVGNVSLTFEEMCTVFTQIEACLNSRPLCPLSSDPSDLAVLTPGHFLIGEPLTAMPEPSLLSLSVNRLSRWQLIQRMSQHFWNRWHSEYLTQLQQRPKWHTKMPNIKVNDLVLLKEDGVPPLKWPMGRIIETHPGRDGRVRVVTLRTQSGVYKRPVVKLCLLPLET